MQMRMTEMEKLMAMEQLRAERVCTAKCHIYANQCDDPNLRQFFTQMANVGHQHINVLSNMLQQAGIVTQEH